MKTDMAKPVYNETHKTLLDVMLLGLPGVRAGKMFGYPAYYVDDKLFACVYGSGVGVKVPEDVAAKLLERPHVAPFQPLGKPKMKEWIQINRQRSEDYRNDLEIFQLSLEFVGNLTKTKGSRQ
jgi:TfoX/Sxy family transcriptional regulator of competence genes